MLHYSSVFWSSLCVLLSSFVCWLILKRKPAASDNAPPLETNKHVDVVDPPTEIKDKYDVFVSFRGEDIREGFLSHLADAFHRKKINVFLDEKLQKGDEIWPSLVGAIEGSLVSVIIFSQNYATSRWCLNELVKALECRDKNGQIVIPVFYRVDPTDVRHQTGSYKTAFAKHVKRYDPTTMHNWREALQKSANLSGTKSSDFPNEAELLGNIINVVFHHLRRLSNPSLESKGLVGIDKSIVDIQVLLRKEPKDVRIVGIWGMGGIGKTTIAEQVFNKTCSEYEGTCFLSNVREESTRHGIIYLKEKLFSTLLGEDVKINSRNGLPEDIVRRIGLMKVLIILDDVNDSDQLELFGTLDNLGSGSRIVVTTRYKQLLIAKEADDIYPVGELSSGEALELFNLIVFNQSQPDMEYHELSERIVDYAKGIPLVLKVLGGLLRGKDKKVWESKLDKLKKMPIKKVYDIMKISYDDLDRKEQKIFLDFACFFNGMNMKVDLLETLLKDGENDNSVGDGLDSLKDMALIIISENKFVSVHDILQEMAWEIVRQESNGNIGNQSRLWDADDIVEVLENDKGTEAIRSISMHLSITECRKLKLRSSIFAKISKLQFLDINQELPLRRFDNDEDDSDILPEGLQSFPNKLRYLRWTGYPLESLPDKFSAENFVILNLSYSKVVGLWDGVQNLVNLKQVQLKGCFFLKELPDFSEATNLEELDASRCFELTNVHPSIFSLEKFEKLDLSYCKSLISLASIAQSSSLSYLNLQECRSLTEFSVTSKNIKELNLSWTCISALPLSFGSQTKLEVLNLKSSSIESLPSCMVNLTRLRFLDLRRCSVLQTLPELPPSLETLLVWRCSLLKTVFFPSIATEQFQENKKRVEFMQCHNLDGCSLRAIELNARINVMKFAHQHLSALKHDYVENYDDYIHNYHSYQAVHLFQGSRVPEWFVYKTTGDSVIIDFSSPPPSPLFGFIFCFILDPKANPKLHYKLKFKLTISDNAGEDGKEDSFEVYTSSEAGFLRLSIKDHVFVIYDQRCSRYLSSRSQNLSRFQIKATPSLRRDVGDDIMMKGLKGFGVSLISTSEYDSFVRQMELPD